MLTTIGSIVYVGEATSPNKITGPFIYLRWEAAQVPLRECEGNGWYSKSDQLGWSFRSKAVHRGWFGSVLDDSTWNTLSLEELIERAIRDVHQRYCRTSRDNHGPERQPAPRTD